MRRALLIALLLSAPAIGRERPSKLGRILYRSGQAAVLIAHSFDVGSSWGKHELNPLLAGPGGTFGLRSAAIKFSLIGAGLGAAELVARRHPRIQPYLGVVDFGIAGIESRVALHNLHYPEASR